MKNETNEKGMPQKSPEDQEHENEELIKRQDPPVKEEVREEPPKKENVRIVENSTFK